MWNDDIKAVYKVLIWLIFPDDIFFHCFCKPLLNDELHEVRSKIQENHLVRVWISERKFDEESLKNILPHIKISLIPEDLSNWLRKKFQIDIEDIDMMKDYSKFSAFDMGDIGLLSNKTLPKCEHINMFK